MTTLTITSERHGFSKGHRVCLTQSYRICGFIIAPGETGTVIDVDPESGDLVIHIDRKSDELDHRANLVCIPADKPQPSLRRFGNGTT